jgi:mxaJ protein
MEAKYQSAKTVSLAIAATCVCLVGSALAADDAAKSSDGSALRICAAANEAPYSSRDEKGFENRIADIIAGAMDRKVEFVWSDKPAIYLVRDQLEKGNCDVVMGVDTGDERLLTTKAYYRAPYVFVERTDSPLDITSFDSPDLMKTGKIAFEPGTPAEVMITKLDLYNRNFNYVKSLSNFKSPRNQYVRIDPARMVGDVANGTADLAIAFSPEVARYVKDSGGKLKMVVVPDDNVRSDGAKVPFHFDQSIGVRKTDAELLGEIDTAIEKARPEIQAVLKDEGIPVIAVPATPPKS